MVTAAARGPNLVAGASVKVCSVQLAHANLVIEFFQKKLKNSVLWWNSRRISDQII